AKGASRFVKFHWKPVLGAHSLVWDEAQKIAGKDPDFNRRDLWEAIEAGNYPEFELGVQIFGDKQADAFDFDILDATKLIPEEIVPVKLIGKMVLDKNPDNYFAETEQVAFCASHVVPGIDFTNDPLLQGRLFSYLDTQLTRLGGPNFHEIPINRPVCPFSNGQRDGMHRMTIDTGNASYDPNSLDGGYPAEVSVEDGGFASYPERIDGIKRRVRSDSFADHFSQPTMFWNSMSAVEKDHIVDAFSFELSKVERPEIRERVLAMVLANIDPELTARVANHLGLPAPATGKRANGRSAKRAASAPSPALSMMNAARPGVKTRKVAILAADGVDGATIDAMKAALNQAGASGVVLGPHLGSLKGRNGTPINVDHSIVTMPSVVFDGLVVAGGAKSALALSASRDVIDFINEAYRHCKPIAAVGDGERVLASAGVSPQRSGPAPGISVGTNPAAVAKAFIAALARHRSWDRRDKDVVISAMEHTISRRAR
ncbi:MAG: catalase, partial [Candidatus Eremiobacteraeota bacterium]|nr:catalase [Candidatus Eremiobacteraeota bacterium]